MEKYWVREGEKQRERGRIGEITIPLYLTWLLRWVYNHVPWIDINLSATTECLAQKPNIRRNHWKKLMGFSQRLECLVCLLGVHLWATSKKMLHQHIKLNSEEWVKLHRALFININTLNRERGEERLHRQWIYIITIYMIRALNCMPFIPSYKGINASLKDTEQEYPTRSSKISVFK